MINWDTVEGQHALDVIKAEQKKGKSYREIAVLLNQRKLFDDVLTSERVRNAKRYYIDGQKRIKSYAPKEDKVMRNKFLSEQTKELIRMFKQEMPKIKEMELTVDKAKPGTTAKVEESVLMLSGCNVESGNFFDRIDEITKKIKELHYKQTASSRIETLHIFMLGDMVVGLKELSDECFKNEITPDLIKNMYKGVSKIAEMLISLLINYKSIHITSICNTGVQGNVNWDVLFYSALEQMMTNYKSRVKFNICSYNWQVKSICNQKFLLSHECKVAEVPPAVYRGYKACSVLNDHEQYKSANCKEIKYVCTADNNEIFVPTKIKEHLMNGSFRNETGQHWWEEYQYFFGVNADGISWRYKI